MCFEPLVVLRTDFDVDQRVNPAGVVSRLSIHWKRGKIKGFSVILRKRKVMRLFLYIN